MNRIGVLSDTHGNMDATKTALDYFTKEKIEILLHAGDLGNPRQMMPLFSSNQVYFAKGNCDDLAEMKEACKNETKQSADQNFIIEFEHCRIFLFHGDKPVDTGLLLEKKIDYVIKGHTHCPEDYRKNGIRILNPGALHRSPRYTIGVLDMESGNWTLQEVNKTRNSV